MPSVAVLGVTAFEGSGWASDSAVVCKAPMGGLGGYGAVWVVSAGAQRGSCSGLLSYDAPSMSSDAQSNVASSEACHRL